MKFAKGRTQAAVKPQPASTSGAASAALQQSPLLRQQAAQLMAIRQGAQQLLQRQQSTDVSQQLSLEEEEPMQGKFDVAQQAALEEEEPLQGKFAVVQQAALEEEEPLQGKFEPAAVSQRQAGASNNTGMPDQLKSGIESLSGYAMDDVKVHYNSAKPAQMQAHAYAQGTDIHLAPGQEQHLPHEAWHVVQQKQGRVKATTQLKGEAINDDPGLEHEADVMGARALQRKVKQRHVTQLIRFEAGEGADWHVHKDHVKFGSNQKSRVDFAGRNAQQILDKLADAVARYGLSTAGTNYQACVDYINANY
ncbi:eCIS core domain-containing protein [Rheinheimera nanhaiensis]|uniref:eCIS core domain-containing protein n=1 Tax=Rheinheimera nanhaiensis E407-8 TaxID=562729 RepID=I1DZJ6_9GAMM|nr:DUF4157 domain-containing protein [Rheinheimera nanhaiensis]GAB59474.1 hypothetical protein RNAN_2480 [Rheinheimera nanhaiensis E407-8]